MNPFMPIYMRRRPKFEARTRGNHGSDSEAVTVPSVAAEAYRKKIEPLFDRTNTLLREKGVPSVYQRTATGLSMTLEGSLTKDDVQTSTFEYAYGDDGTISVYATLLGTCDENGMEKVLAAWLRRALRARG